MKKLFYLVILFLAMIRGSAYIATKNIILLYSPLEIIFFRFFSTGLILSLFSLKKLEKIKRKEIIYGILAGISLFLAFTFQTYGLKFTTVSKQSFLTSLYIIMIPFIQFLFFKKKFQKVVYFSFISILIGLFFISFQNFDNFEISINIGDILTIFCAFSFAINIVLFSCINPNENEILNITIIQMLVIGILSFLSQVLFEKKAIHLNFDYSLIYLIIICTLINFTLHNLSQKYIPAHRIGLILSLESVFGTLFAVLFLNEKISLNFIIGVIFILLGILIVKILEKENI